MNEKSTSEKDMTDKVNEQISALVDGELGSDEQEFLLRRLAHDKTLQGKWNRYHLISDTLQNHLPNKMDVRLATLVSDELEKEDALQVSSRNGTTKKLAKLVAGLSIAASVAVFSIIGIQQYNVLQTDHAIETVAIASTTPPILSSTTPVAFEKKLAIASGSDASPVYIRVSSGTRWDLDRPEIGSRLNGYLVNHNEYASATNFQGMVHYARIAGYNIKKND